MITHYEWQGRPETVLRFGPPVGPIVLIAPPLFEEANRTRAFIVSIQRALADLSLASMLPDLPGLGESLVETVDATLGEWQDAFAAAAVSASRHGQVHVAAFRGGALLHRHAKIRSSWHFAPIAGEAVVRDLMRARNVAQVGAGGTGGSTLPDTDGQPVELAGNLLSPTMIAELRAAAPLSASRTRTVRLLDDPMPSDRAVDGPALWRRSEPGNDLVLAGLLAADLETWVRSCEK